MVSAPVNPSVSADLDPYRVCRARTTVRDALPSAAMRGLFPSAVLLLGREDAVAVHEAYGDAVRYGADGTLLPGPDRVPAQRDTIYDLASLTKTVTAVLLLVLAERGVLDLDERVGAMLPAFCGGDKEPVAVRDLVTHTAGLPATIELWRDPAPRDDLYDRVARTPLVYRPGSRYAYSDLGPMLVGAILERTTGARLDELVAEYVTGPLRLADTGFRPFGRLRSRCAATEAQKWTGRTMVRGGVHDENAWALDGVAGHAGLFGTAADVAALARMLAGGEPRVLSPESGALASPLTASHTGFTGTFWVVDRRTGSYGVLLSNRVHPDRDGGGVNELRVAVAEALLA